MEDHGLPCQALEWSPVGHWKRDRPCKILNDDITELMRGEGCLRDMQKIVRNENIKKL
jgi:hypothetical protein